MTRTKFGIDEQLSTLDRHRSVLETGKPLDIKMEPPKRMLEALKKLG